MELVQLALVGLILGVFAVLRGGPAQTLILSVSVHISSYRARGSVLGAAISTAVMASAGAIFQSMLIGMGTTYNVISVLIVPVYLIQGIMSLGYSALPKTINQSPGATDSVGMGFIRGMYDLTQFVFWVLAFTVLDLAKLTPSDLVSRVVISVSTAGFYFIFLHLINPIAAQKQLAGTKTMMLFLQKVFGLALIATSIVMGVLVYKDI